MKASARYTPNGSVIVSFPFNRWAIDEIKACVPSWGRSYDPETKSWHVAAHWADEAVAILRAAFGKVIVEGDDGESAAGPSAFRSGDAAFSALCLTPNAPPELVQAAYRTLARLRHPDAGGSTAAMQIVNLAYERLRKDGAA